MYAFFQPVPQSVDRMVAKVKTNFELLMALFVGWLVLFACMFWTTPSVVIRSQEVILTLLTAQESLLAVVWGSLGMPGNKLS